jgi:two-component system NtrC family sensor kinase
VACNWRIRHKLMLGMGLVVAVLALLLAGTLKGLASYRTTMRSLTSKLDEVKAADDLREKVKVLAKTSPYLATQAVDLQDKIKHAREALKHYQEALQETIDLHRDLDNGFQELEQVKALTERFDRLDLAVVAALDPDIRGPIDNPSGQLVDIPVVKRALDDLISTAVDLNNIIYGEVKRRIESARHDYRISLGIVLTTSVVGALLMAGLLRFFYRWVFYPIRDLEAGVGKVAQGDFEHRIEVRSGDEIEDLAEAFNDMTSRLRDMYRDLAHQVNERSRQLVRSERLAGVGFLAAGVAHEINNPLASIAFCSEALERRLSELLAARPAPKVQDREVVDKYLKMIQEEAFRCKEIIQRLLEFSRGGERRREPTNLADLIQGVLDMVQHLPNCKGKQLLFNPEQRSTAWVNAQEVKSVVLNLVVNALDSMEEGGRLTVELRTRAGLAEMVFRDTGCGMTQDVLENIFEPFFTRSRTGKGTGLGLSISHRIINGHGGDIEATSVGPGQGSTFTVRLPLQAAGEKVKEQGAGPRLADTGEPYPDAELGKARETNRRAA